MTLRARLLIGLIALTAVGLGVFGAVTYRLTRTQVYDQVEHNLDGSVRYVTAAMRLEPPPEYRGVTGRAPVGTYVEIRDSGDLVQFYSGDGPKLPPHLKPGRYSYGSPAYRVQVLSIDNTGQQLIVAIPMHDAQETLQHLLTVELLVALVVLLSLGVLTWFVIKLGLRPLAEMEQTAGAIAAGDLSRRVDVVDEHTEVGRLGIALNEMLYKIEEAFHEREESEERLRRFVGDASHELRTPLTSIRGYAELFRRGAADRPEDLEKAMRRIEEEAGRMGVLVDDLLLLARLDQGRPLARDHVDLSRITIDAVDDARTVAPERTFDYTPNGAVEVTGDEARLRQVLANLLQNAVRHTPTDTPVHVRVATEGDDAIIEVRDEGPGMGPEDAAHVFERFWRSDASRQRASGGTGLGLAIVAAIADAHGGRAEVQTAPGEGATFRVRVPRNRAATASEVPLPEPAPEPV